MLFTRFTLLLTLFFCTSPNHLHQILNLKCFMDLIAPIFQGLMHHPLRPHLIQLRCQDYLIQEIFLTRQCWNRLSNMDNRTGTITHTVVNCRLAHASKNNTTTRTRSKNNTSNNMRKNNMRKNTTRTPSEKGSESSSGGGARNINTFNIKRH